MKRRPSCAVELLVLAFLGVIMLIGGTILAGPMLDKMFNSMFGMGLK